jgi:hypothetical protein
MDFDIGNLSVDQVRELMARLQNLEVENDRLRVEASRAPTPLAQSVLRAVGAFDSLAVKVIPRPDKYDGTRNKNKAKEFSRKMQKYLRVLPNIDSSLHVDIISGFLTGPADTWFHRWFNVQTMPTGELLLKDLVAHFCPANISQEARRKISLLKQRSSVEDFSRRFRDIMEEIENIDEGEAKTYYVNGLKDTVKKEVLLKDLNGTMSLDEIDQIAIQIDSIVFQNISHSKGWVNGRRSTSGASPMEGIQYNALSFEERMKLQQENRCFLCKRQGTHSPGCRSKYVFRSANLNITPQEGVDQTPANSQDTD